MELTFLGHQSWLATSGSTRILIDPILTPYFGNCAAIKFPIYPPREVIADLYSDVSAIVLTHEHLDHFHLESLAKLDRSTPFFVGSLMPTCIIDAVTSMGFSPLRCNFSTPMIVGAISISFFPPSPDTIFWEKRVCQLLLKDENPDPESTSVFIAVDAEISEDYQKLIHNGTLPTPDICLVSNNSQICPPGAYGAQSSIIQTIENISSPISGLQILNELILSTVQTLGTPKVIGICGNGYIDLTQLHGPFLFSDHSEMASAATALVHGLRVWGPVPGEKISYSDGRGHFSVDPHIKLQNEIYEDLKQQLRDFIDTPKPVTIKPLTPDYSNRSDAERALLRVTTELNKIAPLAITSQFGIGMLSANEYLDGPLGGERFAVTVLGQQIPNRWSLALDLNDCKFHKIEARGDELLRRYPFGFECHLCDLDAVFDGRLQIWDLMGTATRTWFLGSKYASPMAFMISALSEQCRPDLARKVFLTELDRLRLINSL